MRGGGNLERSDLVFLGAPQAGSAPPVCGASAAGCCAQLEK